MKKKITLILSFILIMSTLLNINVFAATPTVYSQRNSEWANYPYGKGQNDDGTWWNATIGTSGCALLSLKNAVYYLNGESLNPKTLADFAIKKKCRINGSGTNDCFVKHAAAEYGSKYNFEYVDSVTTKAKLKDALQTGQVAVWHSPNHFMSIVDYDTKTDKFLVLNSETAVKTKKAYSWITFDSIKSYGISGDGFMLIKSTTTTNNEQPKDTTIKWPATKNIKTYVVSTKNNTTVYKTATSTAKYGTIYATDLITINGYSGSRLKVTYPVSGGTKTGYIDKSAVTSSKINVATTKKTASSKITAYRRSSGNTELGYISKGDVYYEIATQNGRTQVIYPISGGYKMGWIKK